MPIDNSATSKPAVNSSRSVVAPAAFGLGLALAALTITAFNAETVVATGFERAFADLQKSTAQVATRAYDGVSGSEEFWLRNEANANLVKAVTVGRHLTLSANGTERRLVITGVSDADDTVTHIQTPGNRALLVTCREGDDTNAREVLFRLDSGQMTELPASGTPSARQRAL